MRSLIVPITAAIVALALTAPAAAQDPLDMTGTWVTRDTQSLFTGSGRHHAAEEDHSGGVGSDALAYTMQVDEQNGRRFTGTIGSDNHSEDFIAVLEVDFSGFLAVDLDGYFFAELINPDEFTYCYAHVGEGLPTSNVGCGSFQRER